MDVTKSFKFIWFVALGATKPCKIIGFGAMDVTKPYAFKWFANAVPNVSHEEAETNDFHKARTLLGRLKGPRAKYGFL